MQQLLPHKVRILAKSLEHSKEVLAKGVFNPCGKGSKSYHTKRVKLLEPIIDRNKHLLKIRLK